MQVTPIRSNIFQALHFQNFSEKIIFGMTASEKQGSNLSLSLPPPTPCRIIKWVVETGARVRKGTVLLTYSADLSSVEPESETVLKSTLVGVVKERLVDEGEIVQAG